MPRLRIFRPESRADHRIGKLDNVEHRIWFSMTLESDDEGRSVADAEKIRAVTWVYDVKGKPTIAQVEAAIRRIASLGLVQLYQVGDTRYAAFPGFAADQRPKNPSASRLPAPLYPSANPGLGERSPTPPPRSEGVEIEVEAKRRGVEVGGGERSVDREEAPEEAEPPEAKTERNGFFSVTKAATDPVALARILPSVMPPRSAV
jgi:hypothetical protein